MIGKNDNSKRGQYTFISLDDLVPEDHILRKIDKIVNFDFIYDLVESLYDEDEGRPSLDPVILIKLPLIQYLFGIKSMRQTIKEIQVNNAYRWFLGLDLTDPVPHFTTFGKNFQRRFQGTNIFNDIFKEILSQCFDKGLVDTNTVFVDGTHVKANANNRKYFNEEVTKDTVFYKEKLDNEIKRDREKHSKKSLKNIGKEKETKRRKVSKNDPESGWFHKGDHKQVFAYSVQTACDKNGWVLNYTINPGNRHDSQTFNGLYNKIKPLNPSRIVADSGYKTPAIANMLLNDDITPIFPYKRPMTKKGFFKKYEYVYDEYYDCYICPNNKILKYSTTDREGYKEYKSDPRDCESCPLIQYCTESKKHQKVVSRHLWEPAIEYCEDIRHTPDGKRIYSERKESIERLFGTAKEFHGFRYTNMCGKEKMEMKAALTFACLNIKKLVNVVS
jgi:transposase